MQRDKFNNNIFRSEYLIVTYDFYPAFAGTPPATDIGGTTGRSTQNHKQSK